MFAYILLFESAFEVIILLLIFFIVERTYSLHWKDIFYFT